MASFTALLMSSRSIVIVLKFAPGPDLGRSLRRNNRGSGREPLLDAEYAENAFKSGLPALTRAGLRTM
jgi:hypothetical protein